MFKDNPLLTQLKQQIRENLPTIKGTVKATEKNYGFVETDKNKSVFISPPEMKKVLHGDKIEAVLRTDGDKKSAEPEKLLDTPWERYIGRVKRNRDRIQVVADHPVFRTPINAKSTGGLASSLNDGDWVVALLKRHPLRGDNNFFVEIETLAAKADDRFAPWKVALARHQLQVAAPQMPDGIEMEEGPERQDLTSELFITIDGKTTKDMDDALWLQKTGAGWVLTVAIADPAAWVKAGDELDREASERAFTVYLPGDKITMLPEQLSDQYCSLMPEERRAVLCCRMTFDATGKRTEDPAFFTAWIESKHKLAYSVVSDWLADSNSDWQPQTDELAEMLRELAGFSRVRQAWRKQHSLVFADRPDYRFELDDQGNVSGIRAEYRSEAHLIVEESMIAANTAAAEWLAARNVPAVYNVHPGLDIEKMDKVVAILSEQGGDFDAAALATLDGFKALRNWLDQQPDGYADARIRKFQTFSTLATKPQPHYGLGVEAYATWTSPIRKYGDLVNQRIIKSVLAGAEVTESIDDNMAENMLEQRKKHRLAERNVNDALYARYFSALDNLAERNFTAEVIDVNRGGVRARLEENGAVVFIPATLIHKDRKQIGSDVERGVISVNDKAVLKLADKIDVQIHEIKDNGSMVARPSTSLVTE